MIMTEIYKEVDLLLGTNAPFTADYLVHNMWSTGSITRSTANVINFVAALERNYFT
jgi:hypothetical protein